MPYDQRVYVPRGRAVGNWLRPSQWEGRVYALQKGAMAVKRASNAARTVARKVNPYIPKTSSSRFMSKFGKMKFKDRQAYKAKPKEVLSNTEGHSIVLAKGNIKLNLGPKSGQITKLHPSVRPLWNRVIQTYMLANRATVGTVNGAIPLETVNGGQLPLHAWDLTYNTLTHSVGNAYFNAYYSENGAWTQINGSTPQADFTEAGFAGTGDYNRVTKWLHQYVDVKLMLYGRSLTSTTYEVFFWRAAEESFTVGADGQEGRKGDENKSFWTNKLAPYTTNPTQIVFNPLRLHKSTKGPVILKSFKFTIAEKLSTEDSYDKRNVNFRINLNALKNHATDMGLPVLTDITGVSAADLADQSTARNASNQCSPGQRIYMSIMATGYEMSSETTVYAPPSYDIGIKKVMLCSELVN